MPKKKKAARERSLLLSGQPLVLSGYAVLVLFIEENKGNDFHVLGTRVGERVFLAFGTDGHITGAYLYLCAVVVVHAVPFQDVVGLEVVHMAVLCNGHAGLQHNVVEEPALVASLRICLASMAPGPPNMTFVKVVQSWDLRIMVLLLGALRCPSGKQGKTQATGPVL